MEPREDPVDTDTTDVRDLVAIDRDEMSGLAATEYARLLAMLRGLDEDEWGRPTVCGDWSVADMTAHLLGAAEANASLRENLRQTLRGRRRVRRDGRPLIDGINDVQVDDRRQLTAAALVDRLARIAPRAVRGRYRTPGPLRRISVPGPLGTPIPLGYLVDIIYTRDQWMHRIDIARATGRPIELTADHDRRIVADVVRDWATTHREPFRLHLSGPAGGDYRQGETGPVLELDAVDFCLAVSGRNRGEGLLAVEVVF